MKYIAELIGGSRDGERIAVLESQFIYCVGKEKYIRILRVNSPIYYFYEDKLVQNYLKKENI